MARSLDVATGGLLPLGRERGRGGVGRDDCAAFGEASGRGRPRPDVPTLLAWDNAPPHHPTRVQALADAAHIRLALPPFRPPEPRPCEDPRWLAKALVAANRAYAAVQEQAECAVARLASLTPFGRLRKSGLVGAMFQWLST